jgi:hypothetical protein
MLQCSIPSYLCTGCGLRVRSSGSCGHLGEDGLHLEASLQVVLRTAQKIRGSVLKQGLDDRHAQVACRQGPCQ